MKRPSLEAEIVAELVAEVREVAYKQDWSGSALDTVVGIIRKVARRRVLRRRGRKGRVKR